MAENGGLISQAITNLKAVTDQVAGLTGLPGDAVPVQTAMVKTLNTVIPVVEASAKSVHAFAAAASPLLAKAKAGLDAGDAKTVADALTRVQTASREARTSVDGATSVVRSAVAAVTGQVQTLANLGNAINQQVTQGNAELNAARDEAAALDRKKYYWLLLGPFGLVGLGVCIGMIVSMTQKVTGLESRASALRAQVAQWTKMQADIDLLRDDLPAISSKLLSLQNGIEFVGGDLTGVLSDVGRAGADSSVARAFIMTAESEVATLQADAS
jgi:hypothetical protein